MGTTGRLLTPRIGRAEASCDTVPDLIATRFRDTIAAYRPAGVALYVSGQLPTGDCHVANKLMKGWIGSANIDPISRLCMASTVAGHRRAFGADTVPGLDSGLAEAGPVVPVGSSLAWCHPVLHQRLLAARAARAGLKIVVIDPRRTATCDGADLHLPLTPRADGQLFNLLLCRLADDIRPDPAFLPHLTGLDAALAAARTSTPADTGPAPQPLARCLDLRAQTGRTVTVFSRGISQSDTGTDKLNAILNRHPATGRTGRPGMRPLSATGPPNAIGGRGVGGPANMPACHPDIENPTRRAAVQGVRAPPLMPAKPGLKAVAMFRAVESGQIRALWMLCTNPAVSMPVAAPRRPRHRRLRFHRGQRHAGGYRYRRSGACPAARRTLGRKERHRLQRRPHHHPPAHCPSRPGRQGPTAGAGTDGAPHGWG